MVRSRIVRPLTGRSRKQLVNRNGNGERDMNCRNRSVILPKDFSATRRRSTILLPKEVTSCRGDIRYRDINEDGVIDVNDATYIGFPTTPRVIYGFSGFFNFKNIEFSFAFQGSGKRAFFMNPQKISPFEENRAMLKAIYDDHWSADNMKERPFWPRLSTQSIIVHNPQEEWDRIRTTKINLFYA